MDHPRLDLKVDTKQLNETLASIQISLHRHERLMHQIPNIQNDQRSIRKDLNVIRLNIASQERILEFTSGDGTGNKNETNMETGNVGGVCTVDRTHKCAHLHKCSDKGLNGEESKDHRNHDKNDTFGNDCFLEECNDIGTFNLTSVADDDGRPGAQKYGIEKVLTETSSHRQHIQPTPPHPHKYSSTQIQCRPVNRAVRRFAIEMDQSSLQALRKEVFGMKALVAHLQEEHNFEIAHTTDIDSRIDDIEQSISIMMDGSENSTGPIASTASLHHLKQTLLKKYDDLVHMIEDAQSSIREDVNCHLTDKISDMNRNFHTLKDMVRGRQVQMNEKMSTFAKHSDLSAFEENVENDMTEQKKRMDMLEGSIISNEDALLRMKQRYSFLSFVNIYSRWRRKMLGTSWSKWQMAHRAMEKDEEMTLQTKKTMRKVLIRCWFGKKASAWEKWKDLVRREKLFDAKRDEASRVIQRWMDIAITQPIRKSFDKWRRMIISSIMEEANSNLLQRRMTDITLWKENLGSGGGLDLSRAAEEKIDADEECWSTHNEQIEEGKGCNSRRRKSSNAQRAACDLPPLDSKPNQYDLWNLLDYLKSDKDGALQTLAQAIINIREIDIDTARKDMQLGLETMYDQFQDALSVEVQQLTSTSSKMERHLNERYESLTAELPPIKINISEMRNSLHGTINKVKVIEKTHRDRIEQLCEGKEILEDGVSELKSHLLEAQDKIKYLEESSNSSQSNITVLIQRMNEFERLNRVNQDMLTSEILDLNNQLIEIKQVLEQSNQERDELRHELHATRNDLIQTKIRSETRFNEVNDIFYAHGIRPPKWENLVTYGVLYEQMAKEKNYVVPLNSVTDGKKDIDVPGAMASFAFDYAAWVAFEADHEALELVVTGKNPDDVVYAEDETETRRNALIDRFRVKFSEALEREYPDAGSIRLEARNRYLARLMDAVYAALSKHDQISIPASTRLGRVRSAATTFCVACDRPLTSKGKKRSSPDNDATENTHTRIPLESINTIRQKPFNSGEEKGFVMRAGFKMPVG